MQGSPAAALLVAAAVAAAAGDPLFSPPRPHTLNASVPGPAPIPAPAPAHAPVPAFSPWEGEELPAELLVSEFLFVGETKTYLFHKRKQGPLSITVTPCTSSVVWSVSLRPDNPVDVHAIASNQPPRSTSSDVVAPATGETLLGEFEGKELRSLILSPDDGSGALPGAYVLRMRALERDSFVQLFASLRHANGAPAAATPSMDGGGGGGGDGGGDGKGTAPPSLPKTRIWLRRRRRPGHRLTVRWDPSRVDPHLMRYCLVVNPRRHYSTLCEARGELLSAGAAMSSAHTSADITSGTVGGRRKLRKEEKPFKKDKMKGRAKTRKGDIITANNAGANGLPNNDIIIGCVGKRTQYTVSGLEPGRLYRFDLFAVHRRTNLSVPYGRAEMRFDARARPTALRDGRVARVNLKSLDGRAAFRFKIPRPASTDLLLPPDLLLYVMPCGGGAVDVRAHIQPPPPPSSNESTPSPTPTTAPTPHAALSVEVARARVEGYGALRVPSPQPGARLVLRVSAPHAEELRRVSALEVLATTRPERFPFPTLPSPARLHEYDSLRRCDSVTVGWLPSAAPPGWTSAATNASADARGSGAARLRYCVAAREARSRDLEAGRRADQCGRDLRTRRAAFNAGEVPVRVCSEQETTLVEALPLAEVDKEKQTGTSARSTKGAVTTLTLGKLRPGRAYTVQLTVQRLPGGRPLSYDILPVHTKPSCA